MLSRTSADPAPAAALALREPPNVAATPERHGKARRVWLLQAGLLLAVLVWTTGWYWDTASSMAAIWWRSDTFAHGMVVYPISLWLVWRRRFELGGVDCRPSYLGLTVVGLAAFGWLLGELGGVQAARHLAFVTIVASTVWAVLGTPLARAIAFPLVFTLLAVPIGEFLLPMLIEQTADFTVGALRLTGIPVYREGNNFVVPTGHWSVVEACSGLRYLIASLTLGLLYAYLSYQRWSRRILFVAASIAVPIVANWIRAYMIVMTGHLSGMKYAVGVDHLLYGWIFFGIVMLMLFWVGSRWREDESSEVANRATGPVASGSLRPGLIAGALLSSALVAAAPMYAQTLESEATGSDVPVATPVSANGWKAVASGRTGFRQYHIGARRSFEQSFEKDGRVVGLFISHYVNERQVSDLIAHLQASFAPNVNNRSWVRLPQNEAPAGASGIEAVQTRVRAGSLELAVWHWYWATGRAVARPELVKLLQAFDKLLGRGDGAAVVAVYTKSDVDSGEAEKVLRGFVVDMGTSIAAALKESRYSGRATEIAARPAGR